MSYYLHYFIIFFNTYIHFRAVLSESDEFTHEELFNMQRGLTSNGHRVQQSTDAVGGSGDQQSTNDVRRTRYQRLTYDIRRAGFQSSNDDVRRTVMSNRASITYGLEPG